ncbi:phage tail protein [Citrobacter freundii]|uniref:phage tail protein n=1 Tax=Citrobacter freundii TaxID=546 RepID=UPI003C130052
MPQPSPVTSETELFFTEGGNGVPPTFPGPDWFNIIQSELINILRAAGLDPDKMDNTQILAALKKLFLSRSNPFGDIKADGAAAIATALSNLGLGEGSALPVGVPIPWPSATPPTGWLKCNGAAFTASQYPKLALAYPALRLPDLRGEFIRGWDDGRGVDVGRSLLSAQNHDLGPHVHRYGFWTARLNDSSLADFAGTTILKQITPATPVIDFDNYPLPASVITEGGVVSASTQPMSSTETRPRNVSFNYIVRAA